MDKSVEKGGKVALCNGRIIPVIGKARFYQEKMQVGLAAYEREDKKSALKL